MLSVCCAQSECECSENEMMMMMSGWVGWVGGGGETGRVGWWWYAPPPLTTTLRYAHQDFLINWTPIYDPPCSRQVRVRFPSELDTSPGVQVTCTDRCPVVHVRQGENTTAC